MKKLFLSIFLFSFLTIGFGQIINFNDPQSIFLHPNDKNADLDYPVLTVDFEDDGEFEFIAGTSGRSYLFRKDSTGNYFRKEIAQEKCVPFESADINGDNKKDIVFDKWIGIQESMDSFTVYDLELENLEYVIGVDDYNDDGFIDLVTQYISNFDTNQIVIYYNDGVGDFTKDTIYKTLKLEIVLIEDIDDDGDMDFVYTSDEQEDQINVLQNNGGFEFDKISFRLLTSIFNFYLEDTDSDGDMDIMVNFTGIPNFFLLENENNFSGYEGMVLSSELLVLANFMCIPKVADLNNNGKNDILLVGIKYSFTDGYETGLYVVESEGSGNYKPVRTLNINTSNPSGVNLPYIVNYYVENILEFRDVNNDGLLDVFFAEPYNFQKIFYYFENNPLETGTVNFVPKTFSVSPNPTSHQLHIHDIEMTNLSSYKIFDTNGKMMQNGKLSEPYISTQNLPSGTYILELDGVKNQTLLRSQFVKI